MPGIHPQLLNRLRDVLLECEHFASDDTLKAVVVSYAPLKPWRFSLPQANSIPGRVDAVIGYLVDKHRSDTKENALILLICLLGDRIPEGDERHQQLVDLAVELKDALRYKSTTNQPKLTTEPTLNIRGNVVKTKFAVESIVVNCWWFMKMVSYLFLS